MGQTMNTHKGPVECLFWELMLNGSGLDAESKSTGCPWQDQSRRQIQEVQ